MVAYRVSIIDRGTHQYWADFARGWGPPGVDIGPSYSYTHYGYEPVTDAEEEFHYQVAQREREYRRYGKVPYDDIEKKLLRLSHCDE